MQRERDELVDHSYRRDFLTYDNHMLDGEMFLQVIRIFIKGFKTMEKSFIVFRILLQALNGFLMILDCNGELFFATHTIETYLGFHQSDVIHQVIINQSSCPTRHKSSHTYFVQHILSLYTSWFILKIEKSFNVN